MADSLHAGERLAVPLAEIHFEFARGSGPGGQNVNKVSSKAVLRWRPAENRTLPEDVRARFLVRHAARLTTGGDLVIASDRFRDQGRNVADCLERLRALLAAVERAPTPRRPTRPTRSSQRRRLDEKARAGRKKRERSGGWD